MRFKYQIIERLSKLEEFFRNHDADEKKYRQEDREFKKELRDYHAKEIIDLKAYDAGQNSQIKDVRKSVEESNLHVVEIKAIVDTRGKIYFYVLSALLSVVLVAVIGSFLTRVLGE